MNGFCTGCPDNCHEAFRGTSLTQRFCRGSCAPCAWCSPLTSANRSRSRKNRQPKRQQNLPEGTPVPEALAEHLCTMPKGEINVSLFLNGACVGSAHRNQLTKEMLLAPQGSSEGFVNCRPTGVLRVVLHVLNVLNDETNYTLRLEEVAG